LARVIRALKIVLFALLSSPLLWLVLQIGIEIDAPTTALGADPGEAVVHFLGEWGIRVLLLTFSISPLQRLFSLPAIGRMRRLVGLFAFVYLSLHFFAYLFFYVEFSLKPLLEDFVERAFITAGIGAFVCLIPMAVTSTASWQRRLRVRWKILHRLIYPAIALAIIHLYWLTSNEFAEVIVYAVWFVVLIVVRFWLPISRAVR